jgi:capsular polysaccharide biosynthesis protein
MSQSSGSEDLQLADYTGVLRRRWWLIIAIAVLATAGSVGYYKHAHKVYTATASVYVTATSVTANQVTGGRTSGSVNLDTEAQVVQSTTIAQAAAKLMHSTQNVQQLIKAVSVAVPANSQVLAISCEAPTRAGSALCAQSFAQAYLNFSTSSTTASLNSEISALQSRISTLQTNSAKLTSEVASLPTNSTQRATAQEQLDSDHNTLNSLNNQAAQLIAELANPSGGSIISNATPPLTATSPKASLIVGSGLLVGLLIGLIAGFIVDRRDRRIRGAREITQLDMPVLMSLPLKRFKPTLAVSAPRSPTSRAFAELAHVLSGSLGDDRQVILVTDATKGQGASYVAANLAVALARNQPDVMLVCADLEGSVIAGMIGLPQGPGLTETLEGQLTPDEVSQYPAGTPLLRVITPGTGADTADDFRQDAIDTIIADLRDRARYIVVEAPSVTSGPDVYTLAHVADATVLVVEAPRTRSNDVTGAVQQLERIGTAVLGTVLLPSPVPAAKGDRVPVLAAQLGAQPERRALPRARAAGKAVTATGADISRPAGRDWLTEEPDDVQAEAGDVSADPAGGWAEDEQAAGSLLKG